MTCIVESETSFQLGMDDPVIQLSNLSRRLAGTDPAV
jgi:hypothetical protein